MHIGHRKILEFSGAWRSGNTIDEHDDILIEKINSVVNKGDQLWILGDCVFGKHNLTRLGDINCEHKKLIMGNHDNYNIREFLPYFEDIKGVTNYKSFFLSHNPLSSPTDLRYAKLNIHGHTHQAQIYPTHKQCEWVEPQPEKNFTFNVSVEALNGYPISVDAIRHIREMEMMFDVVDYMKDHKYGGHRPIR